MTAALVSRIARFIPVILAPVVFFAISRALVAWASGGEEFSICRHAELDQGGAQRIDLAASEKNRHARPYGLVDHSLEVARLALERAQHQLFITSHDPVVNHEMQP